MGLDDCGTCATVAAYYTIGKGFAFRKSQASCFSFRFQVMLRYTWKNGKAIDSVGDLRHLANHVGMTLS